jgi:membrane protein required for colicin V production
MNWLDIVIIISLVFSVIAGLGTGLVRGICNLAGLILGIFLAGRYYENFGARLTFIHSADVAKVVAFIIILALVVIIAEIIGRILHKILSGIMLGWLDRLLGGAVGLVAGAVSWGALLALWVKFIPNWNGAVSGSFMAKILLNSFPLVLNLLPSSFDSVKNFFK